MTTREGHTPPMTEREVATLREMSGYQGKPYWFRTATCSWLVAKGLARVWPGHERRSRPAHEITEAGITALQGVEQ